MLSNLWQEFRGQAGNHAGLQSKPDFAPIICLPEACGLLNRAGQAVLFVLKLHTLPAKVEHVVNLSRRYCNTGALLGTAKLLHWAAPLLWVSPRAWAGTESSRSIGGPIGRELPAAPLGGICSTPLSEIMISAVRVESSGGGANRQLPWFKA